MRRFAIDPVDRFSRTGVDSFSIAGFPACLGGWTVLAHSVFAEVLKHRLDGTTRLSLHMQPRVLDMEVDTLIRKGFVGAVINLSTDFAESIRGNDVDLITLQLYALMKISMHNDVSGLQPSSESCCLGAMLVPPNPRWPGRPHFVITRLPMINQDQNRSNIPDVRALTESRSFGPRRH